MPKRLLGYDPLTGLKTFHEYDHVAKKTIIGYESDVQPIVDVNKEIQNRPQSKYRKRDDWHVAHIPAVIVMKWRIEDGIDVFNEEHTDAVVKKLNDPAWKYLRTMTGNI